MGLTNRSGAETLATAGLALSHRLGLPLRFVQVLTSPLDAEARSEVEQPTFAIVSRALRCDGAEARAAFESVTDPDPVAALLARCTPSGVLVLGPDEDGGQVVRHCLDRAPCPVQVVTTRQQSHRAPEP